MRVQVRRLRELGIGGTARQVLRRMHCTINSVPVYAANDQCWGSNSIERVWKLLSMAQYRIAGKKDSRKLCKGGIRSKVPRHRKMKKEKW